jgi:hypothetical protein
MKFISATWGRFQDKETMWLQGAGVILPWSGQYLIWVLLVPSGHQKSLFLFGFRSTLSQKSFFWLHNCTMISPVKYITKNSVGITRCTKHQTESILPVMSLGKSNEQCHAARLILENIYGCKFSPPDLYRVKVSAVNIRMRSVRLLLLHRPR